MTEPGWTSAQDDHHARLLLQEWEAEHHGEDPYVTHLLGRLPAALSAWHLARDVVLVAEGRVALGHYTADDLTEAEQALAMSRRDLDGLLAELHTGTHPDDDPDDNEHEEPR